MSTTPPLNGKVAVIGATGRVGRAAVQELVRQDISCNILLRNIPTTTTTETAASPPPTSLTSTTPRDQVVAYLTSLPGVTVVEGDLGNVESLKMLVKDCSACLALFGCRRMSKLSDLWNASVEDDDPSHAKQVNYWGVANVLAAVQDTPSCRRIVRLTGKGESPNSIVSILLNVFASMAKAWNYEGERLLRAQSDIEYTIVRPGVMDEVGPLREDKVLALADDGRDLAVSKIAFADVAQVCVESLSYPNAGRSTLSAMTVPAGEGQASWAPLLEKVGPDRRSFPSDMLEQHKAAVRGALIKVGAVGVVLSAIVVQFLVQAIFKGS